MIFAIDARDLRQ